MVGGAALLLAGGCAANPWAQSFVGIAPGAAEAAAGRNADSPPNNDTSPPVRVRQIPWSRMTSTVESIEQLAAGTDRHPDEWTPEERRAALATLLRGLQVTESADRVRVIGHSKFSTTDRLRPDQPEGEKDLTQFARTIDADTVVWSTAVIGLADRIVQEPVNTYTFGTRDTFGDRRSRSYTETSTTWVPVRVQAEQSGFVAYFLRTR